MLGVAGHGAGASQRAGRSTSPGGAHTPQLQTSPSAQLRSVPHDEPAGAPASGAGAARHAPMTASAPTAHSDSSGALRGTNARG